MKGEVIDKDCVFGSSWGTSRVNRGEVGQVCDRAERPSFKGEGSEAEAPEHEGRCEGSSREGLREELRR